MASNRPPTEPSPGVPPSAGSAMPGESAPGDGLTGGAATGGAATGGARRARVHVVDDDALSRKLLIKLLGFHGYEVTASPSAALARVALCAEVPDAVLLDLQMPGESGLDLLAWMRSQLTLARVPALCVTASVPQAERERIQAAGFAAFVPKPITPPSRLLQALHDVLAGRSGA